MPDIDIQFYAPNTTPRNIDPDLILSGSTWEYQDLGGMSKASIPLAVPFEFSGVSIGDTVKIWVGTEIYPRWIGKVAEPSRSLAMSENRTLTCYGEMEAMNRIRLRKPIVKPGGADLAEFAYDVFSLYAAKRLGSGFTVDVQPTGITLETLDLDDATAREAMDRIVSQAPGVAVWGWEVSPINGSVRFYLRPRVQTVGWQFGVGDDVQMLGEVRELPEVVNRMAPLKGGKAKFPNLLAEVLKDAKGRPNTAFSWPAAIEEAEGNVLKGQGFEDVTTFGGILALNEWTLSGGASINNDEPFIRTGKYYVELDSVGEKVLQTQNTADKPLRPGNIYRWLVWSKRKTGDTGSVATGTLTWRDAGGAQVGATTSMTVAPPSVAYEAEDWTQNVLCPVGATGYTVEWELITDGGAGLLLDDPALFDVSGVTQPGWEVFEDGSGEVVDSKYDYDADAFFGAYCLYLDVTASGENDKVNVRPKDRKRAPVLPGQTIRHGYWLKSPPGATATPAIQIRFCPDNEAGDDATNTSLSSGDVDVEGPGGSSTTIQRGSGFNAEDIQAVRAEWPASASPIAAWTFYGFVVTCPNDTAQAESQLSIRSNGKLLVGAALMRDGAAGLEFIPGDTFERYVAATEVCTPGTDAYLSESEYGRQEEVVRNEDITGWNDASEAWAKAWFEAHATPETRPRLELDDEAQTLGTSGGEQFITPAAGTQVRVSGLNETFGDYWPSNVAYTDNGKLGVSIELGDPEPTLARQIANGGKKGSSSSVSVGGGGASSSIGGTTGTGSAPAYATIQNNGVAVAQRGILNVIGATSIADNAVTGATDLTLPTGGTGAPTMFAGKYSITRPASGGKAVLPAHQFFHIYYSGPTGTPTATLHAANDAARVMPVTIRNDDTTAWAINTDGTDNLFDGTTGATTFSLAAGKSVTLFLDNPGAGAWAWYVLDKT